jgi:hypothetical protein
MALTEKGEAKSAMSALVDSDGSAGVNMTVAANACHSF